MIPGLPRLVVLIASLWLAAALPAGAAPAFSDWAAVVVAGDFRAHNGKPSEVFDNARRDVAAALQKAGFEASNLRQFSVRPERYRDLRPAASSLDGLYQGLAQAAARAQSGCLLYISSHGAPEGLLVGDQILAPPIMAMMLDQTCGDRPTVVVLSACFSGVFVPALKGPNRMVLTAARPDRTSFGCGEADKYPYFDDCFLSSIPGAHDFSALARAVQTCVAAREKLEGATPPSEPQLWIGASLKPMIPLLSFAAREAPN